MKRTAMAVMMVIVFALVMAGCGGGGGGGVAVAPPETRTNTVGLTAQAMRTADTMWSANANAKAGETVKMRVMITNGTAESFKPIVAITLPQSLKFATGTAKFYKTETSPKENVSDEIASDKGAELTQVVSADTYNFVEFQAVIAENAINGAKKVTVKVTDGQTYTVSITINVTDSNVCTAPVNPTCGANQHLVAGANDANGCPTAGTCVANTCQAVTNPTCNSGYHLVAGAVVNGCQTAGTCVQNSCQAVTNPTCNSGYHLVAGTPDSNGCATVGTCVQDSCQAITNPTCNSGYHLVAGAIVNGCQTVGTCVADPVAQTGMLTVRTFGLAEFHGWANIIVTCGSQTVSISSDDLGGGYWGSSVAIMAGSCSLDGSTYPHPSAIINGVIYTLSTGSQTKTTGTLVDSGSLTLTLVYTYTQGGGTAVCGNGAVEGSEECDDGNAANGDGCSSTCQSEHVGPGEPTY